MDKILRAFNSQRQRSKRRGNKCEFHFTLKEWVEWWEAHLGPDWFEKRGPKRHQFCMARFEDKGPYAVWNVKCITNEVNWAEQIPITGEKNGQTKLTKEQVDDIRASKLRCCQLTQKYGVCRGTIYQIKNKRTWR